MAGKELVTAHQQAMIEEVARRLARGQTPMKLSAEGKVNEASVLSSTIGYLDRESLMDEVDTLVAELLKEPQTWTQLELFSLSPSPVLPPKKPKKKPEKKPKQYTLEDLHIHRKRGAPYPRKTLQTAEAVKERAKYLKSVGVTAKNKTRRIQDRAEQAIQRLKAADVWEYIEAGAPPGWVEILIIREKLQQYDRENKQTLDERNYDPNKPIQDLDSSDGFTIYPSTMAWLLDQEAE